MGWHEKFTVEIEVDGDEGTIHCNSPELFEYFSERTPFPNEGGHGFPLAIYDYANPAAKVIYWVSATKATYKQEKPDG